ncbi:glycosyltransferase family 4 protein [Brucella sp. TWI559]
MRNHSEEQIPDDKHDDMRLVLENESLQSVVDILIKKIADQEFSFRESLSNSAAWGATQEQRAVQAVSRLQAIENSLSWRAVKKLNSTLDKYPLLSKFIKRSIKLFIWTVRGQLPAKLRQLREARRLNQAATKDSISANDYLASGPFWSNQTTLPLMLLDKIISFMKEFGPVNLVLAINFYAGGGAESVALDYAKAYAEGNSDGSVIIILTDNGPNRKTPKLPSNIMVVDLRAEAADINTREDYLFLLLRTLPLKTFHIVNSILAYNLLKRVPDAFISEINMIASVFCLQFDSTDDTKIIGYGRDFLPENIDKIDCIVTDNHMFAVEGPLRLGIGDQASKFKVVYNQSKLDLTISIDASLDLLNTRLITKKANSRLTVHWAGRLDRQKRPDLLAAIAELTEDFCDFQVFGGSVVDGDYEVQLRERSNISLCGPYTSPTEWDAAGKGNVFLFTSREEGMPNALIEASYLGYPIVASNVGGVGELVSSETGWPIDKYAPAADYAHALRQVFHDQIEANKRTERLIKLAHSRHNKQSYLKALAEIPGYERA